MDIKFTCVVDGRLLEFMHVADICTLFGNALDNALEHVVTLRDPEKRIIHLTVSEQRGFVYIMMSNYCEEEIAFAGTGTALGIIPCGSCRKRRSLCQKQSKAQYSAKIEYRVLCFCST